MFKITRVAMLGLASLIILSGTMSPVASAAGPYWRVSGTRLEQGKKAVSINLAQGEAELKSTVLLLKTWISCATVEIQNAYITGNGGNQGQGSASSITFTNCRTHEPGNCMVNEPIKTGQVKTHLVEYTNSAKQLKIGELFEPSQGDGTGTYVEIAFKDAPPSTCAIKGTNFPVKGSVVANVFPEGQEPTSGNLKFPVEPITTVKHEGQERTVGLTLGGKPATLSGIFGVKLVSGEKFGAFLT
jgi:hypothetical protein